MPVSRNRDEGRSAFGGKDGWRHAVRTGWISWKRDFLVEVGSFDFLESDWSEGSVRDGGCVLDQREDGCRSSYVEDDLSGVEQRMG